MKRAWKWGNEEAPESDSAFDRMPAHDVSINSHRLYTFLLLFTSLSFVTDYRIMQNISCNLSRIIHACFSSVPFLLCSLSSLPLSLSFSLPLSLSFHSILTKYRYIECKVQIRLEKSVFSSFFRFVKFEIFQIQNLSFYLFFSFYILFQLPGCQEFYYLYFNIYILMINFIF